MQIRQSDLASFAYCAQQVKLKGLAKSEGWREPNLSATLRGTVLHFAFETLQRLHHEGREDALQVAQATFEYFWDPSHITELDGINAPVDEWIGYDTWGGLLQRSLGSLREAYAWLLKDKSVLLGLEHSFTVPLTIDGEEHTLHGTVDRLNLRMVSGRPVIGIDDLKGYRQEKWRLDWEPQWTIYSYASLQPGFWTPFYQDDAIADGFADVVDRLAARGQSITATPAGNTEVLPRRGRLLWAWDGFKVKDTGWRTEAHYARMRAHVREYVKAVRGDMYPLTVNGHVCGYCAFGKGIAQPDGTYHQVCGDAPLPAIQEGIQ